MRYTFTVIIIVFILTACSQTFTSATPTPLPSTTPTLTATVTPTPLPTFTPTPELTSEQQLTLDTINTDLNGAWTIDSSGKVTDSEDTTPEGVTYDIEKGTLMRTYSFEYDGRMQNEITVALTINKETPMPEGCRANFEAWCITKEGKLARKTYSTDRDKKGIFGILGYGYEDDENLAHERNMPLYSVAEQQAILANTDNVDMSGVPSFYSLIGAKIKNDRKYRGIPSFVYGGTPDNPVIFQPANWYAWGDDKIFRPNGKGSFDEMPTTPFVISELNNQPISFTYYFGSDGKFKIMFGDTGELMNDRNQSTFSPLKWSEYYKDHPTKL